MNRGAKLNWVLGLAVYFTFVATIFRSGVWAWGFALLTILTLAACIHRSAPRRLFSTDDPERWPIDSQWRQFRIVGYEPDGERFIVLGERAW